MRRILVKNVCGAHCLSPDEGEALFKEAYELLRIDEDILLDFIGVETLASSFLNTAVGRLFGKFDHSFVEGKLRWSNLDEQDERVLKLVIENAKDHFGKTEAQRKAALRIVDTAIGDE